MASKKPKKQNFDSKTYWKLRDPLTKKDMGYKLKLGDAIHVPKGTIICQFVKNYNALENYDMGIAVEIMDKNTNKVDHFALLYAFRKDSCIGIKNETYDHYLIREETLTNLDILELIDYRNKQNKANILSHKPIDF